jgi:hypothetical protein
MRIRGSGVDRLGEFDHALVDPKTGRPFDLVVVTGPMGSGKTSVLEAIISAKEATAPYLGQAPWSVRPEAGARSAKIRLDWELSDEERARFPGEAVRSLEALYGEDLPFAAENEEGLVELLGTYDDSPALGKVEYFHAERRLPRAPLGDGGSARLERPLRLAADDRKYARIPGFLLEISIDPAADAERRAFDRALALLTQSVRRRDAVRAGGHLRPAFESVDGRELALWELSRGEQQAVLFAATFVRSGVSRSVVLVDTPELYLASSDVVAFVHGLAAIGADNQIIVATGSGELAEAVAPASVVRLSARRAPATKERAA